MGPLHQAQTDSVASVLSEPYHQLKNGIFFFKKNSLVFCKSNAQLANYPLPYLEEAYGKAMEFYSRIL